MKKHPHKLAQATDAFSTESEATLARIHAQLAKWRADRPDSDLLAALRGEFRALRDAAASAGFSDIAALSHSVENLLARDGNAVGADDVGLLNLLEEVHDGLAADLGFAPAASRNHAPFLNSMVESLLSNPEAADSPPVAVAVANKLSDTPAPATPPEFPPDETPQGGLLNAPTCTFNDYLPQLRRLTEDAATRHNKPVELTLAGGEVEVDRQLPERMLAAFAPMIENSIAHGIESAAARKAAGKPAAGRIRITAVRQGGELAVEYADDGGGLDAEKLAARAVEAGMTARAEAVGEAHWLQIVTQPGGSGMSRVYRALRDLGGLMALKSEAGDGVRFQFRLPLPQVAQRALMVTVGRHRFALLARAVERLLRAREDQVSASGGRRVVEVGGRRIPIVTLADEIGERAGGARNRTASLLPALASLVLIRLADRVVAFEVDEFHDVIQIVGKKPDAQLASIRGLAGVAVLPDSGVAMILDPGAFVDRTTLESDALSLFASRDAEGVGSAADGAPPPPAAEKTIRVVALETRLGPVLIPVSMVAEIVARVQMDRQPSDYAPDWVCGDFHWRGLRLPLIDSAGALGGGLRETRPEHAAILRPMKGGKPDAFFALTSNAPPTVIEIDSAPPPLSPVAPPPSAPHQGERLTNLLGRVQIERRTGIIPDLSGLARQLFRADPD